jgi:hypothetical protein
VGFNQYYFLPKDSTNNNILANEIADSDPMVMFGDIGPDLIPPLSGLSYFVCAVSLPIASVKHLGPCIENKRSLNCELLMRPIVSLLTERVARTFLSNAFATASMMTSGMGVQAARRQSPQTLPVFPRKPCSGPRSA